MEYILIKDFERGTKLLKAGQTIYLSRRGVQEFIDLGLIEAPKKSKKQKIKKVKENGDNNSTENK